MGFDGSYYLYWFGQFRALFKEAGWVFKPGNNSSLPSIFVIFLGLGIDSRDITINIHDFILERVIQFAQELLSFEYVWFSN